MENNTVSIKENFVLRKTARNQLSGKWGTALLLCLLYTIITGAVTGTLARIFSQSSPAYASVGSTLGTILCAPFALGLICCFMRLVRNEPFRLENLFDGFKNISSSLVLQFLITLFTFLWTLLLIVPGIIAYYRYAMAFYILNDNPEISASEALNGSKKMMMGYKWKLFCLQLSFIGWGILSILTIFIGFLWLVPYMQASTANFYQNLKEASETKSYVV